MLIGEIERRHELLLRLVFFADDANDFLDIAIGDQQAFQQVQAAADALQAELDAPPHGFRSKLQPLPQERDDAVYLRTSIQADDVEVQAIAAF